MGNDHVLLRHYEEKIKKYVPESRELSIRWRSRLRRGNPAGDIENQEWCFSYELHLRGMKAAEIVVPRDDPHSFATLVMLYGRGRPVTYYLGNVIECAIAIPEILMDEADFIDAAYDLWVPEEEEKSEVKRESKVRARA